MAGKMKSSEDRRQSVIRLARRLLAIRKTAAGMGVDMERVTNLSHVLESERR